jgi:hypothetical protein
LKIRYTDAILAYIKARSPDGAANVLSRIDEALSTAAEQLRNQPPRMNDAKRIGSYFIQGVVHAGHVRRRLGCGHSVTLAIGRARRIERKLGRPDAL